MGQETLEQKLQQALLAYPIGVRWYLACSGGRDSLALAFACWRLYQADRLTTLPILIHVNHRLQAVSDDWASQVANFAKAYGFDCHVATPHLDPHASENEARQARYQVFFELMAPDEVILLAHHANDQGETLLMRLVNGAGIQGLSAMRPWQAKRSDDDQKTIYLLRPWLDISRVQISAYANKHKLNYIDDPTNDHQHANARALIRHQLLPLLQQLNPQAMVNIARSAKWLGEIDELLSVWAKQAYKTCLVEKLSFLPWVQVLDIGQLALLDEIMMKQVLRHFVQGDEIYPPNAQFIHDLLYLIQRKDSNHQTYLYWQASTHHKRQTQAFGFCRYRQWLYRYRQDVWQWLIQPKNKVSWQINEQGSCVLHLSACQLSLVLHGVTSQPTSIVLSKKQAQRLGVAPWLRAFLWQATLADGQLIVLSFGHVWAVAGSLPCGVGLTVQAW